MGTTAVQDRSTIDLQVLKDLLGITGTDQDDALTRYLRAAKQEADRFLGNPFEEIEVDDCGMPVLDKALQPITTGVLLPIPEEVELGLVDYVRGMMAAKDLVRRASSAGSAPTGGTLTSKAVGAWSKGYSAPKPKGTSASQSARAAREVRELVQQAYWLAYRWTPGY